jgi:hypothetical protein
MAEHKKKDERPEYVQVLENLLPDKTGRLHQAGQIVAAQEFADVDKLIAAHKLAPVAAEHVVAADVDPTPTLLKELQVRARTEDQALAAAQVPAAAKAAEVRAVEIAEAATIAAKLAASAPPAVPIEGAPESK